MNHKPRYLIKIKPPKELNNFSYIYTGLYLLREKGLLDFIFTFKFPKKETRLNTETGKLKEDRHHCPKYSYYTLIDRKKNSEKSFAIDLSDSSFFYSKNALVQSDFVFKRSFYSGDNTMIKESYQNKLHPFGVTFSTLPNSVSLKHKWQIILGVFINAWLDYIKLDGNLLKRIKVFKIKIIGFKDFKTIKKISLFEQDYIKPQTQKIFYQKRCFPYEPNLDIKALHQQRYQLVKALKKYFKNDFVGGLSSSKMVNKKFFDAKTNLSNDPKEFLMKIRECGIGIYTRGISNSIGFTLPEYFSQSKVVIAERLKYEIPTEIKEGMHVLFFDDYHSLIAAIKRVQSDNELFLKLSKQGKVYFDDVIHPAKNMQRILKEMGCEI